MNTKRTVLFAAFAAVVASLMVTLGLRLGTQERVGASGYAVGPDGEAHVLRSSYPALPYAPPGCDSGMVPTSVGPGVQMACQTVSVDAAAIPPVRLTPIDTHTALYYTLNEDASATSFPNTGYGGVLNLTSIASPCFPSKTGIFNTAMGCSNNSGTPGSGVVTVSTSLGEYDAGPTTSLTLSLWLYPIALGTNFQLVLGKAYYDGGTQTAPYLSVAIEQTSSAGFWNCQMALAGVSHTAGPTISGVPTGVLQVGSWQHLACTWDGTTLTSYWDASNVGTAAIGDGGSGVDWGTQGPWELMYSSTAASASGSNGYIDDVRVEPGVVRSQAYLQQLVQYGLYGSQN